MAKRNYVYDIETYPNFFCAISYSEWKAKFLEWYILYS